MRLDRTSTLTKTRSRPSPPAEGTAAGNGNGRARSQPDVRAPQGRPALRSPLIARRPAPEPATGSRRKALVGRLASQALVAALVLAFTHGWTGGELIIDGPGVSLWVEIILEHWRAGHGLAYWMPELWAGTPFFALFPSIHLLMIVPLAAVVGADVAVKIAVVAAQVVGAWGACTLARSLWGRNWPAIVAGVAYGCHPNFVASGPLSGHEASVWVFAITPWLVWSLRLALRGEGAIYVAVAGLCAAFAVLQQAEHAFGLALLCALLVGVAALRARQSGTGPTGPRGVVVRAGAVVALAIGTTAFWLVPFLKMRNAFVLTTAEDVRTSLDILGGALGRRPGAFLTRAGPPGSTYDFERLITEFVSMQGTVAASFYLGWVCLLLTLVTVVLISRRNDGDDGTVTVILIASVLGIWLSLGSVPLARSNLISGGGVVALVLIGSVGGLLIGAAVRRLHLGRWAFLWGFGATALLFAAPYVSPILALQRFVPFLEFIRFPRFYPLAGLGVAIGAAYPLVALSRRFEARNRRLAPLAAATAALAICGLIAVDFGPYRGYYRMREPDSTAAYAAFQDRLARASMSGQRAAMAFHGDPHLLRTVLDSGWTLSTGWPHPLAEQHVYKSTVEAFSAPLGYRDALLGLSGTSYLLTEYLGARDVDPRILTEVVLEPNPDVLPLVRAYHRVVALPTDTVTTQMAAALATRGIGVVDGAPQSALAGLDVSLVAAADPCAGEPGGPPELRNELLMACGIRRFIDGPGGDGLIPVGEGVGAMMDFPIDGLTGISVWLDRPPDRTELSVYEVNPDGRSLGREIRRVLFSGYDHNAMPAFRFEPLPAGGTYGFLLSCSECADEEAEARVFVSEALDGTSAALVGGELRRGTAVGFVPLYDRIPVADRPDVRIDARRAGPGGWQIDTSGAEPALVVVAESLFPGWEAKVDGRPVPIVRADSGFIGVKVDAGDHRITLHFQRPSGAMWTGRLVTIATLVTSLLFIVHGRRRRQRQLRSATRPGGDGALGSAPPRSGQRPPGRRPRRAPRPPPPPSPNGDGSHDRAHAGANGSAP